MFYDFSLVIHIEFLLISFWRTVRPSILSYYYRLFPHSRDAIHKWMWICKDLIQLKFWIYAMNIEKLEVRGQKVQKIIYFDGKPKRNALSKKRTAKLASLLASSCSCISGMAEGSYGFWITEKILDCLRCIGRLAIIKINNRYNCKRIIIVFLHVKKIFIWLITWKWHIRVILRQKKGTSCNNKAWTITIISIFILCFLSSMGSFDIFFFLLDLPDSNLVSLFTALKY